MTKSLKLSAMLLVAVSAFGVTADSALGQVTMRFDVSRDVGIWGHDSGFGNEQLSSAGDSGRIRPFKSRDHAAILDFDTAAMSVFLNSDPGAVVTAELFILGADNKTSLNGDIGIQTVESTNDWVEGNGDGGGGNLNWTAGTSAATYFYASTAKSAGGSLDALNSLIWNDPDSGPYTFTSRTPNNAFYGVPASVTDANPTPEFTNSTKISAAAIAVAGAADYVSTSIDANIINAMATEVNNRGIRLGQTFDSSGNTNTVGTGGNFRMWDRNQDGGLFTPYLEITLSPSTGQDGDFDGDLDVDGADFLKWQVDGLPASDLTLWQNNYPTPSTLASVNAVPEPSSIALLMLSSTLLMGRRNARRSR